MTRHVTMSSILVATLLIGVFLAAGKPAAQAQAAASLRVVHAATGAPALDTVIDSQQIGASLAFRDATAYVATPSGRHTVRITAAGQPQEPLVETQIDLQAGLQSTLVLTGESPVLAAFLLADDNAPPPAGQAKVRVVHGARDVPAMDVGTRAGLELVNALSYGQQNYVTVPAGVYTLDVRPDGQPQAPPMLSLPDVALSAGQIVTYIAVGKDTASITAVPVQYATAALPVRVPAAGSGMVADQTVSLRAIATLMTAIVGMLALVGYGYMAHRTATMRSQ